MKLNAKLCFCWITILGLCGFFITFVHLYQIEFASFITCNNKSISYIQYENLSFISNNSYVQYENVPFISNNSEIINYVKKINNYLRTNNVTFYNPQKFESKQINEWIILVILSCGRWDKLSKSIESIEKYNTYKYVLSKYVLDDCQDLNGFDNMNKKYGLNTSYQYNFINGHYNEHRGIISLPRTKEFENRAIRSMSMLRLFLKNIYSKNKTLTENVKYMFQTENDWEFYEHGFIEDSFGILYGSKIWHHSISLYTLRNTQMDENDFVGYPLHTRHSRCGGEIYTLNNWKKNNYSSSISKPIYMSNVLGYNNRIIYYWISNDEKSECWGGYTNNPHLQNIDQLLDIDEIENNTLYAEFQMSCFVKSIGYIQAYPIYNGYVKHIGTSDHTTQYFKGRKKRKMIKAKVAYSDKCIPRFL